MDVATSVDLFQSLKQDDLCFAYSGSFFDSMTHKIIDLTSHNIDSSGNFVKFKNKISFLMAECYQNIVRHGISTSQGISANEATSAFFARSRGNSFFITSANTVTNNNIADIQEKLDRVNSLNTDELRILQKQVLAKGKLSEKGGAGLGIIEMARRTGQKIEYCFVNINDSSSMFYLMLKLKTDDEISSTILSEDNLKVMIQLHEMMMQNDMLILHKGDFSENSVLPVIQMIEKNLQKNFDPQAGKQRLFNISVELLQNISMHAYKNNGVNEAMFVLGKTNGSFYISTSNFIDNKQVEKLTQQINHLNQLSKDELNELYRQKLLHVIDQKGTGAGIGLIYIFRKCKSIHYSFTHKEKQPLYTMLINV